ncbi:zinc finger and BTB domain-containing protein 4 [Pristis pectinata]|uniref:zinc finger and BTB domain-containing protein 4 n=1 Tax=Pristis pectinata TaxID=685728 RepID=UPI00223D1309|nr:zinc finger and BTB domain-containing protein 4 [Pristis pectinata]XP_051900666.1 zinc finger and BTB domain-containing protein 4 [Pristis pectinata]
MASSFEVTDRAHCRMLLHRLNEQWLQGSFCDVTIVVEESKFKAHRNVLAAFSLYFKELLSGRAPCPLQPVLELREVKAQVFAKILGFMYSSRLVVERLEEARELAAAGTRLGIPFLEELAPRTSAGQRPDYPQQPPPGPKDPPHRGAEGTHPSRVWHTDRPFPSFPVDLTSSGSRQEGPSDGTVPHSSPGPPGEEEEEGGQQGEGERSMEDNQRLYTLSTVAFRGLGFSVEEEAGPGGGRSGPQEDGAEEEAEQGEAEGSAGTQTPAPCSPQLAPPSALPSGRIPALNLRLHRTLSCPHCHKAFVHVKRLQTHRQLCRRAGRPPAAEPQGQGQGQAQPPSGEPGPAKARRAPRHEPAPEEEHFMKVVDGHLLYFCAVCQRSYMTLSSLKRHANVHSWRRKYPCRYCDKVFALAEYRTKHEVWHTGERRYQCIFCWDTFVTYYNLKTHQKSFHGVDPGLTISQKTPNGGYKPKLNAFKLYRLLPMRSQKRPYKTYSHSGAGALEGPGPVSPLPGPTRACPSPGEEGDPASRSPLPEPGPDPLGLRPAGAPGTLSSVITYGRAAKSSVIVHSKALVPAIPSSVIAYNGRCPRQDGHEDSALAPPPPPPPAPGTPDTTDQRPPLPRAPKPKRQAAPGRPKTLTYVAKPACPASAASGSRPGPLCQITVRIGEEAIVKRRISESDLIRDKAGPTLDPGPGPAKGRRPEVLSPGLGAKKARAAEEAEPCCRRKADDFLGAESADEVSDQDADDNLWRPYYSYKPKRRGAGFQRAKRAGWRRKLSLRPPAARWLHRAAKGPGPGPEEAEDPSLSPREQGPEVGPRAGSGLCAHGPEGERPPGCSACGGPESAGEPGPACDKAGSPPPPGTGRKAPAWHACAHCPKACRTAAALGRHQRRHLMGDRPGLEQGAGVEGEEDVEVPGPQPEEGPEEGACVYPGPQGGEEEEEEGEGRPGWEPYGDQQAPGGGRPPSPIPRDTRLTPSPVPQDLPSPPLRLPAPPGGQPCPAVAPETRTAYASAPEPCRALSDPGLPASGQEPLVPPAPTPATRAQETEPPADGGGGFGLPEVAQEEEDAFEGRGPRPDPDYPVQEFPLPLVTAGSCRSHPELQAKGLAFHPGALRFKEGEEDLGKVAFYQEPYQLVYGHPLLAGAYPYSLGPVSPLPVALNMVIQDKGQPLPLLHRMFVYPTPCRDEAHPLPPPPPLPLGAGGTGGRDEAGREVLAGDKAGRMY